MTSGRLVNLGCGAVFHPAWTNLDSLPVAPGVIRWDLQRGLPFGAATVDACYASHVLEHLPRRAVLPLLGECHRVIRPGGVLRVVVPDLEGIVRAYLTALEAAARGEPGAEHDHDWMIVELLDQMLRTEGGGEIHRRLTSDSLPNSRFVIERLGLEAEQLMSAPGPGRSVRARPAGLRHFLRRLREEAAGLVAALLLGARGRDALREGLFRRSGQLHLWMYDRLSLARTLRAAGFVEVERCDATSSRIPNFSQYDLDTESGRVRKPDSLFMEAIKP